MNELQRENIHQERMDLFNQILGFGYTAKEAQELVEIKFAKEDRELIERSFIVGRMLPVSYIPEWKNLDEAGRKDVLWNLGFDIKKFNYLEDVACYTTQEGKRECGLVIRGSERVDKEWITKVVDGCNVATDEARYWKDRETLEVMRGNKKS
jgi:hypothetical protein